MKNTSEIHWGIIGCGDVCEVKSGPAFNKVGHSNLAAVMRRDIDKAKDYALRNDVKKVYNDAGKLISDDQINAIYIATPPAFHEEYAIQSIKAGKPVYLEKPVTLNSASCERIIEASKSNNVPVSVAHYRRALPNFLKIKSLIAEEAIGQVRLVRISTLQAPKSKIISQASNWRVNPELSGGGLFHDLAPHQLDIIYWIFGRPLSFSGHSTNQSQQYEAPDFTRIDAEFENKVILNGVWAFNVAPSCAEEICEIIGTKGKISFAFFRKPEFDLHTEEGTEMLKFEYPENIQRNMIDAVVKFFRGEGPNPCSLEDALVTMKMIDSTFR